MNEKDEAPASSRSPEPEPSGAATPPEPPAPTGVRWKLNLALFVATVFSVFLTGAQYREENAPVPHGFWPTLASGWSFGVPLLAILLTHEFGHYFAARWHKVEASLPFFIPLPFLSPFGTMGAVIAMKGRIRSRAALLDIGASGPLAGLAVAIPVLAYGLKHSPVKPMEAHGYIEGQSLLYLAMKRIVLGPIPDGHDVYLNRMAFAGWVGLFVTALNLIPIGQLDGGHIAYSLLGPRQNRIARALHLGLLGMFLYNVVRFSIPMIAARDFSRWGQPIGNAMPWLVWYLVLRVILRLGGGDHPPTEPGDMGRARTIIAVVSLCFFVLLFMPTPWASY